jgi:Domain of unknown function (DUF4410)
MRGRIRCKTHCKAAATLIGAAAILTGCAATAVQPVYEQTVGGPPPAVVVVYTFAIDPEEVTLDRGVIKQAMEGMENKTPDEQERAVEQDVQSELVKDLVSGIKDLGLAAQAGEGEMAVPPNALLITGQFVDVNEGNRARRLVIGLGVGQAAIDTKFQVMSHAGSGQRVLAEFTTHTDSGEMPGAAITMGAGAAAQGGATAGMAVANMGISGFKAYRSSLDPMIDRTAKKIVAQLSQYFSDQGWISPDKVQQPLFGQ